MNLKQTLLVAIDGTAKGLINGRSWTGTLTLPAQGADLLEK